jgi:two-component system CheB/CheR fusion protein
MKNLLNSTDIATVFLDDDLNVRRFTAQAVNIIKLIPTDVGRPLTDISSALRYPELVADAGEVLRTLAFSEKQVPTRDGRWFTVRIMPYRTLENRIDGLVLTFVDISVSKKLEEELRKEHKDIEIKMARREDYFAKTAIHGGEKHSKGAAQPDGAKPSRRRRGKQEGN